MALSRKIRLTSQDTLHGENASFPYTCVEVKVDGDAGGWYDLFCLRTFRVVYSSWRREAFVIIVINGRATPSLSLLVNNLIVQWRAGFIGISLPTSRAVLRATVFVSVCVSACCFMSQLKGRAARRTRSARVWCAHVHARTHDARTYARRQTSGQAVRQASRRSDWLTARTHTPAPWIIQASILIVVMTYRLLIAAQITPILHRAWASLSLLPPCLPAYTCMMPAHLSLVPFHAVFIRPPASLGSSFTLYLSSISAQTSVSA